MTRAFPGDHIHKQRALRLSEIVDTHNTSLHRERTEAMASSHSHLSPSYASGFSSPGARSSGALQSHHHHHQLFRPITNGDSNRMARKSHMSKDGAGAFRQNAHVGGYGREQHRPSRFASDDNDTNDDDDDDTEDDTEDDEDDDERHVSTRYAPDDLSSRDSGIASASQSSFGFVGAADEVENENFKVVVRVRPPLERELSAINEYRCVVDVDNGPAQSRISRGITIHEHMATRSSASVDHMPYSSYRFTFDHVYGIESTQKEVYEISAKSAVQSALQGYNATIMAYGQTGTGKTYTMEGSRHGDERGIIPRAIEDMFGYIENDMSTSNQKKYLVRASYLQIYNEVISDLLKPERTNLVIREDKRRGVFVEGLSEWVVRTPQEIYGLMERGAAQRATGSTKLNELSSRSHAVFMIIAENSVIDYMTQANSSGDGDGGGDKEEGMHGHRDAAPGTPSETSRQQQQRGGGSAGGDGNTAAMRQSFKVGKLNLVDLAGSERVRITGATGRRLEESKKINQSLSALLNVISALTETKPRQHIPYRDSKLTRILEDSLGGNCKTTMMAMISPAQEAYLESLSTLKFANRAKTIKNEARVNEDVDQKTLLRKHERELRRLREELEQRSRDLVDKRRLLEVEEQKRRAEQDKLAAITALEARSREFMKEKQDKLKLEERIKQLEGQLLIGGRKLEDTPAFRSLVAAEHVRIRTDYERRLKNLERERLSVEEDKAQVDRYKQLLLKQRDIMIALTARLNERDEQIVSLQEELEAYDRAQRKLEDQLDSKSAELIALRKAAMEHNAKSPVQNRKLASALGAWGYEERAHANGDSSPPRIGSLDATESRDKVDAQFPSRLEDYVRNLSAMDVRSEDFRIFLMRAIERERNAVVERGSSSKGIVSVVRNGSVENFDAAKIAQMCQRLEEVC